MTNSTSNNSDTIRRIIEETEATLAHARTMIARLKAHAAAIHLTEEVVVNSKNESMEKHLALYESEVRHAQAHRERSTVALEKIADYLLCKNTQG